MPEPYVHQPYVQPIHNSLRVYPKTLELSKTKVITKDGNTYHFTLRYHGEPGMPGGSSYYLHRKDAPAVIFANGDKHHYTRGKLDRKNGPAIECASGEKHWYVAGVHHNVNGPATVYPDGKMVFALNGTMIINRETWEQLRTQCQQHKT